MSEAPGQRISYAQSGEDVRVWRTLRDLDEGFYVEVGASDPVVDSLTAALSEAGWRGVLVEPEPTAAEACSRARPRDVVVNAAASARSGVLAFAYADKRGQGSVSAAVAQADGASTRVVPAVRLTDVLDDLSPPAVHFMSIDVEGYEVQVLEGLDLRRWRPWILCVEATEPDSRNTTWHGFEPLLLGAEYRYVTFDGVNRWYVAEEHADLSDRVAEPFSALDEIIDGWRRLSWVQERAEAERLRGDVEDLRDQVAAGDDRLAEAAREHDALRVRLSECRQQERAAAEELRRHRDEVGRLGEEVVRLQDEVRRLERAYAGLAHERDLVAERERVMRESKSWRVTAPLRTIRWQAGLAAARRRGGSANASAPALPAAPTAPETEVDRRRRAGLEARRRAFRGRAS